MHLAAFGACARGGRAVKGWYAVYTRPHAEARALEHLQRQGYHAYLPRYRTRVSHARRLL
jgi:hypothetical protein